MNGFEVYKKFKKSKEYNAGDIYFILLTNRNNTVDDLFLNTVTDKDNKKKKKKDNKSQTFKKYFNYQSPGKMYNTLRVTQKNIEKYNIQVNLIKNGLID